MITQKKTKAEIVTITYSMDDANIHDIHKEYLDQGYKALSWDLLCGERGLFVQKFYKEVDRNED